MGRSGVHVIKIMQVITRGYSTCFCATIDETITLPFDTSCCFNAATTSKTLAQHESNILCRLEIVALAAAVVSSGKMPPSAVFRQDALHVEHEQSMIAIVGFSGSEMK